MSDPITTWYSVEEMLRREGWAGCLCDYRFGGLGRLYGVDMGKGWIRTTTHPDCPHHTEARRSA